MSTNMAGILFGADGAGLKSEIQIIRMKQSKHGTGGALMAEYIEREALLKELAKDVAVDGNQRAAQILECIINAPAADVAPVVHGRWTTDGICNQCGCDIPPGEDTYCPNCGARMDGISNYDGN